MHSKYLINDKPLLVLPKLASVIGLHNAILLQQVHYWLLTYEAANKVEHFRDGCWWVYNAYCQWKRDNFPFWSVVTIGRVVRSLEKKEILVSARLAENPYDRRKWYTIDYTRLDAIMKAHDASYQSDTIEEVTLTPSTSYHFDTMIPEKETTTETTYAPADAGHKARQRNPLFDALALRLFSLGEDKAVDGDTAKWIGKLRKGVLASYPDLTADEFNAACDRWQKKNRDHDSTPLSLPRKNPALAAVVGEYRAWVAACPPAPNGHTEPEAPAAPIETADFRVFFATGQFAGMYKALVASGDYERMKAEGLIQ